MPELPHEFWTAVGFIILAIALVIGAYTGNLLISHRRLQNQQIFSTGVLNASAALIVVLDINNRVVAFNKAFEELSGYVLRDIQKQPAMVNNILPGVLLEDANPGNKLPDLPGSQRVIHSLKSRPGIEYQIDWQVSYLKDSGGKIVHKIVSGLDITDLKLAEKKVIESQEQLLEYQKMLREMAELAEEEERRRIAEQLHDRIGHSLALARIKIGELNQQASSKEVQSILEELDANIQNILKNTRSLIFEISPPSLHQFGLVPALRSLAKRFMEEHRVKINFEDDGLNKPLENAVAQLLFKAVRELLVNAKKHARAQQIWIGTSRNHNLFRLEIRDDGVGFDYDPFLPPKESASSPKDSGGGFGLLNIKNRVEYYRGTISVDAFPENGSRFLIEVPCGKQGTAGSR